MIRESSGAEADPEEHHSAESSLDTTLRVDERPLRRIPETEAATTEEIKGAIEALNPGQLLKLEKYARYRVRGLGRRALGRDHFDLLREAMTATLGGERRWRRGQVDFFTHLTGVMRSLSSHWRERFSPEEAYTEAELTREEGGPSPLLGAVSELPDSERLFDARQQLEAIERHFAQDPTVPSIIDGFRQGMTGPEIQSATGLSKKDYESAIKRMRRGIAALEIRE